jgi:hypothetical protein
MPEGEPVPPEADPAGAPPIAAPPPEPPPPAGSSSSPPPPPPGPPPPPPGIREQVARTFGAGRRLADAHVTLAKAELAVILEDAKLVAIQVGVALALLIYVGLLVPVGMALFVGEWIFGSMGWGILHGTLCSVATAVVLILGALRVSPRYLAGMLLVAVLAGAVVGVLLGFALPNAAYAAIGTSLVPGVDVGSRPLLVGMALWAAVLGLLGALGGGRVGGAGGAFGGLVAGALLGALAGALTAISFSLQVGAGLGVTTALIAWPVLGALGLRGFDPAQLKARFMPQASIDAARETMSYVQERLPGRKDDPE